MLTAELDYHLPVQSIAQHPLAERDASRLLHVCVDGRLADCAFTDLPGLLRAGDLLVVNQTRVRRARLAATDSAGRQVELLVLRRCSDATFLCLSKPAKRAPPGAELRVNHSLAAVVVAASADHPGARLVRFDAEHGEVDAAMERAGSAPLPPYIHERLSDQDRYQTTYAAGAPLSAAAPTAGLHFTERVRDALRQRGVGWAAVELEVGLGTFAPIRSDSLEQHLMHEERYSVSSEAAERIKATRDSGGRIVAVGTTVVRTLESAARDGTVHASSGSTRLFITPGYDFHVIDGLLTNYHQPRSSLLALLAGFIGTDAWRAAYDHALAAGYRFLSFGDCMLCWRLQR